MRRFGEGILETEAAQGGVATSTGQFDADAELRNERPTYPVSLADGSDEVSASEAVASRKANLLAAQFDLSIHDAIVTVQNLETGNHRTFKIETLRGSWNPGKRIISLLGGPDNMRDYKGFGWVEGSTVKVWTRFRGDNGELSVWEKFGRILEYPTHFEGRGLTFQIEGRCKRCGRRLTTPRSLTVGYGPTCEGKS